MSSEQLIAISKEAYNVQRSSCGNCIAIGTHSDGKIETIRKRFTNNRLSQNDPLVTNVRVRIDPPVFGTQGTRGLDGTHNHLKARVGIVNTETKCITNDGSV